MVDASSGTGEIPDKLYFKIGEVSEIVGVDPHVLRYWESEFNIIRPLRATSKQRLYRHSDVENLLRIKTLLYDHGYTIAGARKTLKDSKKTGQPIKIPSRENDSGEMVKSLKKELYDLKKILEG